MTPQAIYIAGTYEMRGVLCWVASELAARGHTIVSTWLGETKRREEIDPVEEKAAANRDLAELAICDLFILDTVSLNWTGGREVELGYALALTAPQIWLVGPRRNIFHHLADKQFPGWIEALKALETEKPVPAEIA